jgi:hypothetical protein
MNPLPLFILQHRVQYIALQIAPGMRRWTTFSPKYHVSSRGESMKEGWAVQIDSVVQVHYCKNTKGNIN